MKEETCEQVLRAADEVAGVFGYPSFCEGIDVFFRYVEEQAAFLKPVRTREGFREILLEEPEPSRADLLMLLATMRGLPFLFRKMLPKLAKELPPDPGGHPRSLTPQESLDVCVEVGVLLGQGVALTDAQTRVAQRKDVSVRTIQRVWQNRKQWNEGR